MEKAKCNVCYVEYTDTESVEQVKKWLAEGDGYAPCPNISCPGTMEIIQKEVRV